MHQSLLPDAGDWATETREERSGPLYFRLTSCRRLAAASDLKARGPPTVGLFSSCAPAAPVNDRDGYEELNMSRDDDASIIVLDKFVQATRDSGYKDTVSALSEIVDNSLQAGAKNVWITISASDDDRYPVMLAVLDDGSGMDRKSLRQALRFGGSSRFNDRSGMGRFGMGLPNSSLSQARRVEVYSWQKKAQTIFSYLDVDRIAAGEMTVVPDPTSKKLPAQQVESIPPTGTLVVWSKCDRLSHSRISTIVKKLQRGLGQIFRHYIWKGVKISINGEPVKPVDPLFLKGVNAAEGTVIFGEPTKYEITLPPANGAKPKTAVLTVTFTELPVHELHTLSNDEKRERGIANGAGVSVVRAGREVDHGWFLMGSKRRENYDDWWRCEVAFDPDLDELMGVAHTKQQIRPQEYLTNILVPDMESMAKALNGRVRQAHLRLKAGEATRAAEETAASRESLLEPLPKSHVDVQDNATVKAILKQHPVLKKRPENGAGIDYRIVEADVKDTAFFSGVVTNGHFVLAINPDHPFFRRVYKPLSELDTPEAKQARTDIELLLIAAARAEAASTRAGDRRAVAENRQRWSDIFATFLNR